MLFFRLYSKKTIFVGKDSSMDDKWKALEKYNLWGGNTYQLGLERKSYTDKIGNFVGNNLVKVLIGQRRSKLYSQANCFKSCFETRSKSG